MCPNRSRLDGRKIGQMRTGRQVDTYLFLYLDTPHHSYVRVRFSPNCHGLALRGLAQIILISWTNKMIPQKKLCCRLKDVTVGAIAAAFALLLIIILDLCKPIVFERRTLLGREIVKPRIVVAKDRPLDLAVRRSQWLESVLFLHLVRNFQPTEGLDLQLG